jgi:L-arabinose isomerase
LTKFFGDEPPLLRLFLKNLGYEKFASAFEEAKIGLLELPYLSEERLEKLGVPMGPRMRILQEAKTSIGNDQSLNVYIL